MARYKINDDYLKDAWLFDGKLETALQIIREMNGVGTTLSFHSGCLKKFELAGIKVEDGEYICKNEFGYSTMDKNHFEKKYEPV